MNKRRSLLPLSYLTAAILGVVIVLPSILRPPPEEQTQSAEFSPDAPPDEDPDAIISSLRAAASRTAGGSTVVEEEAVPTPPPEYFPTRGQCWEGDPPRQVESIYSTRCIPAWTGGDNGGETSFGVTRDEFRVTIGSDHSESAGQGPVDTPWDGAQAEPAWRRAWRVFQEYYNRNFEFYGRKMRVYNVNVSLDNHEQGRAAAVKAKKDYKSFAAIDLRATNPGYILEAPRQKMVTWLQFHSQQFLDQRFPYAYTAWMNTDQSIALGAEMICKQMQGPPTFNDRLDPTFDYTKPRVFGLVNYVDDTRKDTSAQSRRELNDRCGMEYRSEVVYNLAGELDQASAAITKFRADGVTTIVLSNDWFVTILFTNEADAQGYYPEWVHIGTGGNGLNITGRLNNPNQWAHAVGLHQYEIEGHPGEGDDVRAYHQIDPGGDYDGDEVNAFFQLLSVANGVQWAGPDLNPETYFEGLLEHPGRPPKPRWSVGGDFARDDLSFIDWVSLQWWDPLYDHPQSGQPGAWRHVNGGCRYTYELIPDRQLAWFEEGVATPQEAERAEKSTTCD